MEPVVRVGILTGENIHFILNDSFSSDKSEDLFNGYQQVLFKEDKICWNGEFYEELNFIPQSIKASFTLQQVTIGVDFHWERREDQTFQGQLQLLAGVEGITVVNILPVESYLSSVISSEMNASAPKEFLKAHAVISRGWLLAQITKKHDLTVQKIVYHSEIRSESELIRWYDREDHLLYDVCADDHCQRYQGITRSLNPVIKEVIEETRGEVLEYEGRICDTRFSKCCGGKTEQFEYCWEPVFHPYLKSVRDDSNNISENLQSEDAARNWILSSPQAYCNTENKKLLSSVLNNYDQETTDFYRWEVVYSQKQLSELIQVKLNMDFGDILDLIPLSRGTSGRIDRLLIKGTKRDFIIGKELEIRRTLSETHLYSSAFLVEREDIIDNIPQLFRIKGAGWGHGAGLCQIGAARMGEEGYNYQEILSHYFDQAILIKKY